MSGAVWRVEGGALKDFGTIWHNLAQFWGFSPKKPDLIWFASIAEDSQRDHEEARNEERELPAPLQEIGLRAGRSVVVG